jgi:riboflavin biosynthesis pyrimidine reductase
LWDGLEYSICQLALSADEDVHATAGREAGATSSLALQEVDGLGEVGDADVVGQGRVLALEG